MIDIKEIWKLCDKATPGPWKIGINSLIVDANGKALFFEPGGKYNAEFIAKSREIIPALLDELEAAQNTQRWIPVTERLPEKEIIVMLFLKNLKSETKMTTGKIYNSDDKRFNGEFCIGFDPIEPEFLKREVVTHWMPLPEPPKGENNEQI